MQILKIAFDNIKNLLILGMLVILWLFKESLHV